MADKDDVSTIIIPHFGCCYKINKGIQAFCLRDSLQRAPTTVKDFFYRQLMLLEIYLLLKHGKKCLSSVGQTLKMFAPVQFERLIELFLIL